MTVNLSFMVGHIHPKLGSASSQEAQVGNVMGYGGGWVVGVVEVDTAMRPDNKIRKLGWGLFVKVVPDKAG
jgi:hypothetical protein